MERKTVLIAIDKETGTLFDDYTLQSIEEFDTDTWTQVCDKCAKEHCLLDSYLETGAGHGICGVLGCNNESDHYYDFNREERKFEKHDKSRHENET
jgi:hypothetical protein